MLYWAFIFFVIAIIAGAFNFTAVSAGALSIARLLFFLFLVLFVVSLLVFLFGAAAAV